MKLTRLLSEDVRSNYTPLSRDSEGLLVGGFGSISLGGTTGTFALNDCACNGRNNCSCREITVMISNPTNNCTCPKDKKAEAVYSASLNNCECNQNNCDCPSPEIGTSTKSNNNLLFPIAF